MNKLGLVFMLAGVATLTGCAQRRAEITLEQPHAPPSQRKLELASDWAFTAMQDSRRLCLVDFALPGAVEGPRDFRVFFVLPGSSDKAAIGAAGNAIAAANATAPANGTNGNDLAAGFFVQKVGRLSGKTEFVAGNLTIDIALLQSRVRVLRFDARCADGTRIVGEAKLRESEDELRVFLLSHAGDVAGLDAAARPPTALAGDSTPARPTQSGDQPHTLAAESQPAKSVESPAGTK